MCYEMREWRTIVGLALVFGDLGFASASNLAFKK